MSLPQEGRTYKFKCVGTANRYLNLYSSGTATNAMNVVLFTSDESNEQKWYYTANKLHIKTNTQYCLDRFTGTSALNNADIYIDATANDNDQLIEFEQVSGYDNRVKIKLSNAGGGSYYLTAVNDKNGTSSGKSNTSDGNVFWTLENDSDFQKWDFLDVYATQKLRLPFEGENVLYLSRMSPAYYQIYNRQNYGAHLQCTQSTQLLGLAIGTVVAKGENTVMGNYLCVRYNNCISVYGAGPTDLIVRYYRMQSISVNVGDIVNTNTVLGYSGFSGEYPMMSHFYFEIDTDTNYPTYTPMLTSAEAGGGLYSGTDSCVNPFDWLFNHFGQTKSRAEYADETYVFSSDLTEHDVNSTTPPTSGVGLTLNQLKAKFPQGKYWNHVGMSGNNQDGYTDTPCPSHDDVYTCNSFNLTGTPQSWQCLGFAEKCGYDTTGLNPKESYGWTKIESGALGTLDFLKPGDIIRYQVGSNPDDKHAIFVTGVNGDDIIYGDCNGNAETDCKIRWDELKSKQSLLPKIIYVLSSPYTLQ